MKLLMYETKKKKNMKNEYFCTFLVFYIHI